jgi:surfeit locus 1 family protein
MQESSARPDALRRPAKGRRRALTAMALLLLLLFAGLGTWQVVRLQWKLDLIARVDARVHAAPSAPPSSLQWSGITAANDEYRHLHLSGHFLFDLTTPVQAVTARGSGFWLLTPLCQPDGSIVLVNRGFIPGALGADAGYPARRASPDACAGAAATVDVTGLLRLSEPKGGFLRKNDAANQRWYSRDVAAIAAARGLRGVAPFFVDADARQPGTASPQEAAQPPVGGMTVIAFPNNHLVYALTWYALAAMVGAAWWWIAKRGLAGHNDAAA